LRICRIKALPSSDSRKHAVALVTVHFQLHRLGMRMPDDVVEPFLHHAEQCDRRVFDMNSQLCWKSTCTVSPSLAQVDST